MIASPSELAAEVMCDVVRGVHPAAILAAHEITAGQLQNIISSDLGVPSKGFAYGTPSYWISRFRELTHLGLEEI